jgi:hypothetical protein
LLQTQKKRFEGREQLRRLPLERALHVVVWHQASLQPDHFVSSNREMTRKSTSECVRTMEWKNKDKKEFASD